MSTKLDLTGETAGPLRVLGEAPPRRSDSVLWTVECPHGHQFELTARDIRRRQSCGVQFCPTCVKAGIQRRNDPSRPKRLSACSFCHAGGHKRHQCPKRLKQPVKVPPCTECGDLEHRRPEGGTCPSCKQPHRPERMPTLRDIAAQPHTDRRMEALVG